MSFDRLYSTREEPRHDQIKKRLARELNEWVKEVWGRGELEYPTIETEAVEYNSDDLERFETSKSRVAIDVLLEVTADKSYAFEVKASTSDLVNWFTQKHDYEVVGHQPVLVTTPGVVYSKPHRIQYFIDDEVVIFDPADSTFHWSNDPLAWGEGWHFGTNQLVYDVGTCPECDCWTMSDGPFVKCQNCWWRAELDDVIVEGGVGAGEKGLGWVGR